MARYDYKCPACGTEFEVEHPMSERPTVTCPACGTVANQVFGASGIVFKGHGFYNTDQRGKGSKATSSTSSSGSSAPKSDKSEKKSEAKPETSSSQGKPAKKAD